MNKIKQINGNWRSTQICVSISNYLDSTSVLYSELETMVESDVFAINPVFQIILADDKTIYNLPQQSIPTFFLTVGHNEICNVLYENVDTLFEHLDRLIKGFEQVINNSWVGIDISDLLSPLLKKNTKLSLFEFPDIDSLNAGIKDYRFDAQIEQLSLVLVANNIASLDDYEALLQQLPEESINDWCVAPMSLDQSHIANFFGIISVSLKSDELLSTNPLDHTHEYDESGISSPDDIPVFLR